MPSGIIVRTDLTKNSFKGWTRSEINYLKEHYVSDGPEVIAIHLNRSLASVMTRAYMLRKDGDLEKPEKQKRVYLNTHYTKRKTDYRLQGGIKK
jgi:hypothetical protein